MSAASPASPLPRVVLDASALLAFVHGEPGSDVVAAALNGAAVSAVNWSEVVQKALARGIDVTGMRDDVFALGVTLIPFEVDDAERAAHLRTQTKHLGLSLGDRACLALGMRLECPVYTADRSWSTLLLPVTIHSIR